jgi:hypothetical protein
LSRDDGRNLLVNERGKYVVTRRQSKTFFSLELRSKEVWSTTTAWGGALGSFRLVSSPILLAPGTISRANSICFAGNPAT